MDKLQIESLEYLQLGYIVTDMDHKILVINHAARELLAATKVISSLEEVMTYLPERLDLLMHVKYCSVEHKSCSFNEVELGGKQVRVFLSPIFEDDELRGNLLTLEDISGRVAQEKARDQFLTFLVHELRTPLTAVRGNSQLIKEFYKDVLKDKELSEVVDDIHTGSEYVLQMVNQFLDMSRLESGQIKYDLKQFEAMAVIRETVQSLHVLANERGLALTLEADDKLALQVVADPGRVKQILTNLIGNGLKFTKIGSVTVHITTDDKLLTIFVTDTGAGIPDESRAGMFQKYFQAANNEMTKDSSKSTGLGLYVTKLMVEGMGGQISLGDSKLDEGSTFSFTVTLATPERIKLLAKQLYDMEHGVEHAQVSEHTAIAV